MRSAKSIDGLDYSMDTSSSPSPRFDNQQRYRDQSYTDRPKLRPALSLAQLCDLDSADDLVSPNRLIAQFECMIQNTRAM